MITTCLCKIIADSAATCSVNAASLPCFAREGGEDCHFIRGSVIFTDLDFAIVVDW